MTDLAAASLAKMVEQHLKDNRDQLAKQAVAQAVSGLADSLKWKAEETATKQLLKFYETEIAPAIDEHLKQNREHIIAAVCSVIGSQVDVIAKKLAEDMTGRLNDNYKRKQVLEALFGVGRSY